MRTVSLFSVLVVAGCASAAGSGAGATSPASQTIRVQGPTGNRSVTMSGSDGSTAHVLPFTVDQVWRAMPDAFATISLPVQTLDVATKTIGTRSLAVRHKLGNTALNRLIDCGNTQLGPNADDYDVRLTFMVTVGAAAGGGTNVSTALDAVARPMNYAQEFSQCTSRGALETKFIDALKARLER